MAIFSSKFVERLAGAAVVLASLLAAVPAPAAPTSRVSPFGAYLAASHAEVERDYAAAAKFMDDALVADPGNPDLMRRDFLFRVGAGEIAGAIPLAMRIADLDRHSGFAELVLVLRDMKNRNYRDAREHAKILPHAGLQRVAAPVLAAWADVGLGQIDAALASLADIDAPNTLPELTILHRALIADYADRINAAARDYEALTRNVARLTWRTVEIAGNFDERHQRVAAARRLYLSLKRDVQSGAVVDDALARMAAGRIPPRVVVSPQDGAAEVLFDLASLLNQGETLDAALFYTRLALYLRPRFPIARLLLAEIRDEQDHAREALALYGAVDPTSPLAWSARLREAAILDQLGETETAIALLRRLATERPAEREPWIELGDILRGHNRFAEAVTAYDAALARTHPIEPDDWRLYYSRGVALERSKRWPRAEADFRHALKLEPDQPLVLNYLGYSWIDQGVHLDEALHMVERAVELRPNDGYIVDSLGWAYYRLGNYAKATENLERAIELEPEDPTINDHLGDVYWRTGRRLEARYQWNRALEFKPDSSEATKIDAKLEHGLVAPGAPPANGG
jgi:Flp pilus assembly protein TadD